MYGGNTRAVKTGKKKKKKKKKIGLCSKFVFPIKAQPNNFFQILFQQCICIYNLQL